MQKGALSVISVIVPVRNAQPYLSTALQSILEQDDKPHEIIVVDGASTDGSAEIAAATPGVTLIQQSRHGLADARNLGIRAATGNLIAFLDADDYWPYDRLRVARTYLDDHPQDHTAIGQMVRYLQPGTPLPRAYSGVKLDQPVCGYTPGACMVRRSVFDLVGGFDVDLRIGCDSDWFARLLEADRVPAVLSDIVLYKRIHAANLSANTQPYRAEFLHIIRRSLQRRRHPLSPQDSTI